MDLCIAEYGEVHVILFFFSWVVADLGDVGWKKLSIFDTTLEKMSEFIF